MATASSLDGLGERLAQIIKYANLNQSAFARELGVSAGFLSEVVRGQKKPGAEFLFAVQSTYGVSIDWLLSGQGTMKGSTRIDIEQLRTLRLQIALVRTAIIEGSLTAKALLLLVCDGRMHDIAGDAEMQAYLNTLTPNISDLELALELYNGHLWTTDEITQRRNLLEAAIAHFESKKPIDNMAALTGSSGSSIQVNIGSNQRIAGRDYHEN